jgi:hypothetical protein
MAVPVPNPEAGLTVSQETFSLALQVSVPPPVFAMVMLWAAGFTPPVLPVKARLTGLSPIAGVAFPEVTVRVTGTDFAIPPVPLICTVLVYVPAARPKRLTLTLIVPALEPDR